MTLGGPLGAALTVGAPWPSPQVLTPRAPRLQPLSSLANWKAEPVQGNLGTFCKNPGVWEVSALVSSCARGRGGGRGHPCSLIPRLVALLTGPRPIRIHELQEQPGLAALLPPGRTFTSYQRDVRLFLGQTAG